eukprot:jgi/Botrbrau1/14606/Bobra.67_2s0006.1
MTTAALNLHVVPTVVPSSARTRGAPVRHAYRQPQLQRYRPLRVQSQANPNRFPAPTDARGPQAPSAAVTTTETAVPQTAVGGASGDQLRQTLKMGILQQLLGPHFNTWLDPARWDPDRVVIQARRLWYYSTLLQKRALAGQATFSTQQIQALLDAVKPAFKDLLQFWIEPAHGWLFDKNISGNPVPALASPPQIHMYGFAFGLFAVSTFYQAAVEHNLPEKAQARDIAIKAFTKVLSLVGPDGGVPIESYLPDFITPLTSTDPHAQNAIGHPLGLRSVNVHIHLLEALTAFHDFVARHEDDALKTASAGAIRKLAGLLVRMKVGPRLQEYRVLDDATVAYEGPKAPYRHFLPGHNVESTFLIHDAFRTLGEPDPTPLSYTTDILEEAEKRVAAGPQGDLYLPHIFIQQYGASDADMWTIGPEVWQAEINWWAQMEYLGALVHADQRRTYLKSPTGDPVMYMERASRTWQFVRKRFVHPTAGYLYERLDPATFAGEGVGHSNWKGTYHTTRALVRCLEALAQGPEPLTVPVSKAGPLGAAAAAAAA